MKIKKEFIVHNTGDETILVPTGAADFSGIVKGNKTVGCIFDCLKTDTTRDEIIAKLKETFDAPAGAIERDVDKALDELRGIGALDE